jgi:Methyltransferase domain
MIGVRFDTAAMIARLNSYAKRFNAEYDRFPLERPDDPNAYYGNNGWFPLVDGVLLYCFVRDLCPSRIVEVGSGYSTRMIVHALDANRMADPSSETDLISIDPYLGDHSRLRLPPKARLVRKSVQDVPLAEFEALRSGDILFIDSSHMGKLGSDVFYEIFEVLPRLQPGVVVHIHDIFFPRSYPADWVLNQRRFWNEQNLLHAFLMFNDRFEVLWAGPFVQQHAPKVIGAAIRSFESAGSNPGYSFWMRRVS